MGQLMRKLFLLGIAAITLGSAAQAADMPLKAPHPPPPVYSWTGCYWGGHVGWGWGRKTLNENFFDGEDDLTVDTVGIPRRVGFSGKIDTSGAVFGGQVGCNYQFANNWVIGV